MNKLWLSLVVLTLVVTGCSTQRAVQPNVQEASKPLEPVTLKLYQQGVYFTDQDFATLIAEPVKKKYPHITVEKVTSKVDLPEMVAAGTDFDFFATWNGRLPFYKDLGIYGDITPLAKKQNFDLTKFDNGALDAVRVISEKGELYAMPFSNDLYALYYNKDIFDKFGVEYPHDGMTWEETIELGRKVTRMDSGVQFSGLAPQSLIRLLFPLSLNVVDAKTNTAQVNNDMYKRAFDIGKQIYSIQGNTFNKSVDNQFIKDRTLAMEANIGIFQLLKNAEGLNWDVVQYPSYKERPNTYGFYNTGVIIPNKNSKHQEDIMRMFEVFYSDEVQSALVRKVGQLSVLKDPKYTQMFGADIPQLQGKKIQSIFKSKPAAAPAYSIYYNQAYAILNNKFTDVMTDKKDVNSALREADEEIDKSIKSTSQK
jgi:ABC-type glycerol-3-phosphate transport system substrate-binding protein